MYTRIRSMVVVPPSEALTAALDLLQCPDHRGVLTAAATVLRCSECGPVACLADEGIFAAVGGSLTHTSRSQRLMQSACVARIYERWWRPCLVRVISRLTYRAEDALVDRYAQAGARRRVLELCCGTARATRSLVTSAGLGLGIDLSLPMLREARRRAGTSRVILLRGDAQRAFARANAFDLAICFAALHLLTHPAAALMHATQALRPGGVFVGWALTTSGPFGTSPRLARAARRVGLRLFAPGALRGLVQASGLTCVETSTDGSIELVAGERRAG